LVWSPSFETSEKISNELIKRGANLSSDGRPTIGLSSIALAELVFSIDDKAMIIPCHVWTPWFSLYGANSGFDSIEDCFGEYSKYIYGVETGLSSDPFMNWQIKELENRSILSFSDAHSMAKMGREATVFMPKNTVKNSKAKAKSISYEDIRLAIMGGKHANFKIGYTIEFYPEEGKYHYTGHRNCNFVQSPDKTKQDGDICPICGKPLTIGVMHRVEELSGSSSNFKAESSKLNSNGVKWIIDDKKLHPPFVKLVPLLEIIAESMSSTVSSQRVIDIYNQLCKKFGSEIAVLLKASIINIEKEAGEKIAEGIKKVRSGEIVILPGFDGQYGIVKIWEDKKVSEKTINAVNQLGIDF
jgi:uncharacterized protein (TIGR00375 family)